jgi:serine/threonine-protein kinase
MAEESPRRLRALFDRAADLSPGDRSAFLDATCADEPDLRARVEHLLACDERLRAEEVTAGLLDSPLVRPAEGATPSAGHGPATEVPPGRLGRYEVLEEIGRGGMGRVLRGHDPELGRDLAVKVLLEGHRHDPAVVSRFTAEAQIGGQLQHPGVVPVYEVGRAADQRPYFTMKLVRGRTLAALLRERADPHEGLPRFLQVFEQVCQTLAYAHSRGVIHRDLKPANVMVGAFGEVQVMDWGLAKVLEREGGARTLPEPQQPGGAPGAVRTARSAGSGLDSKTGHALGTPAYMAPEQATGTVDGLDERCDVFGLGAILCEVLTGRPPYCGTEGLEVLNKAARANLAEAFARLDGCGADPDLIRLAKSSLAADAAQRPRDAGVLAAEMAAHRESMEARLRQAELAQAQARSRAEEERKRRRLTAGLAGSVLLTVLVAGGGWLWIAWERAAGERQARELQAKLTREAGEALTQAASLRQQAQADGPAGKWAEVRAQARRAETLLERLPDQPELGGRVRALLRELDDEEADRQLLTRLDGARLLKAEMGPRDRHFNDRPALAEFEAALRDYRVTVGAPPGQAGARIRQRPEPVQGRVVAALDDWLLLLEKNREDEQAKWLAAVLDEADPDPWRQQLRVARRQRQRPELEKLADDPRLAGQPPQALLMLGLGLDACGARQQSQAVLRRAQERYPNDFWINHELGMQVLLQDNPAEAVRYFTACAALRPESPGPYINLGSALDRAGDLEGAIAVYHHALSLKPETATAYANLGHALLQKGDTAGALAAWRRGLALRPDDVGMHNDIGVALSRQGDPEGAVASYRQAVALKPDFALACGNLGAVLRNQGRFREAIAVHQDYLKTPHPEGREEFAAWIRTMQHLIELDDQLDDFLKGARKPASPAQQLDLGGLCRVRQLYAAAAGFYAGAFATPGLADNPASRHRFEAACCAVLAAGGLGRDAAGLDEAARADLRRQALGWLEADYDAWAWRYDAAKGGKRNWLAGGLRDWQQERRLAGVRDPAALDKLPVSERERWQRLWADVEALASRARPGPLERGRAHAAHRQWAEAARCYDLAVELGAADDGHAWFEHAAVLLLSGDRQGYARACARLVERCGKAPGLRAYHVARACTLSPDAGQDVERAARLADQELKASGGSWSLTQQAALHYRAGRFAEAVPLLQQSLDADRKPGAAVLNWLWLALANQRLGKAEEARRWLDRASRWLDGHAGGMPAGSDRDLGLHLHDWLEAHVLLREAEALLRRSPAGSDQRPARLLQDRGRQAGTGPGDLLAAGRLERHLAFARPAGPALIVDGNATSRRALEEWLRGWRAAPDRGRGRLACG